jgi:hypothetical protein
MGDEEEVEGGTKERRVAEEGCTGGEMGVVGDGGGGGKVGGR